MPTPMEIKRLQRQRNQSFSLPFSSFIPDKCSQTQPEGGTPSLFNAVMKGTSLPLSQRLSKEQSNNNELIDSFDHLETISDPAVASDAMVELQKTNMKTGFEIAQRGLDWSLKSGLKIISSSPLSWISRLPALAECEGVCGVSYDSSTLFSGIFITEEEINALCWKSLTVWSHPSYNLPLPSQMKSKVSSDQVDTEKRFAWLEAFRSIFFMLRSSKCTHFYYKNSSSVVLFANRDFYETKGRQCNTGELIAIISKSTPVFRKSLAELDIEFSSPLESSVGEDGTDKNASIMDLKSFAEFGGRAKFGNNGESEAGLNSLIVVEGLWNVHGLFDLLLNLQKNQSSRDFPVLLSPVAFLGSTLQHAKIKLNSNPNLKKNGMKHSLSIEGWVLPLGFQQLSAILQRKQLRNEHDGEDVTFTLQGTLDNQTVYFNCACKSESTDNTAIVQITAFDSAIDRKCFMIKEK